MGDEPDEDDDEMNNTDGDEEGEEEQDDILIVEGDDEGLNEEGDETDSPNLRGKSMKKLRAVSNCSSAEREHKATTLNLTPASKALNASQEEMSTQLYGGDIYLLGGSHFLMKDLEKKEGDADDRNNMEVTGNKISQASTTTGSEVPYQSRSLNR